MKQKINKTLVITLIVYIVLTFIRMLYHQPWYDEAHAWTIAQELNFTEIFRLMRLEGHTFIWYLLLMPFARADFHYPYPMLIINWLFCITAIIIMWAKAPFNNITKILITFSYPFFNMLNIIARCYAIGVMFLFILANLYKNRLKHPLWFSACVSLCANTSVMALIGASAFGFIFAYDMIKSALENKASKKDFIISFSILALGASLIILQLFNSVSGALPNNTEAQSITKFLMTFVMFFAYKTNLISVISLVVSLAALILIPFYLYKDKRSLFFYLYSEAFLLAIFLILYSGLFHHIMFLIIYPIIAMWMVPKDNKGSKLYKITNILFAVLFMFQVFKPILFSLYNYSGSKIIANSIIKDEKLSDSNIVIYNNLNFSILPYLKKYNVNTYNYCLGEKTSYDAYIPKSQLCNDSKPAIIVPEIMEKFIFKNKSTYSLMGNMEYKKYTFEDKVRKVTFEPYKKFSFTAPTGARASFIIFKNTIEYK